MVSAEKVIQLLKPFEEITVELSKRETTSSIIIPTIQALKLFLLKAKSSNLFAGTNTTVEKLQSSIEKRLTLYLENKTLCLSILLDPRYSYRMKFQKAELVDEIKKWTIDNLKEMDNPDLQKNSDEDSSSISGSREDEEASLSLSNLLDELASGKQKNIEEQPSKQKKLKCEHRNKSYRYNKELEEYLNLQLISKGSNPFLWWNSSKELFPNLSKLALKFLSAPASSI